VNGVTLTVDAVIKLIESHLDSIDKIDLTKKSLRDLTGKQKLLRKQVTDATEVVRGFVMAKYGIGSPQWNAAALGPEKRGLAESLIRGLRKKLAPGSMLHFGQGKWYPGEPLPRWALRCDWRIDGVPIWENIDLIARPEHDYGYTHADAKQFIEALARRLEVNAGNIMPAYEDTFYYLWQERKLPVNLDVADSKLADAREREELLRVFERGLMEPVGYVVPVRRRQREGRIYWSSQHWFLRPDRLLLVSGDSPVGFRLPLESLPWVEPDKIEYDYEDDPFADREKLPPHPARRPERFDKEPGEDPQPSKPQRGESAEGSIRPALCVEVRQGRLHVFLPYAPKLADFTIDRMFQLQRGLDSRQ